MLLVLMRAFDFRDVGAPYGVYYIDVMICQKFERAEKAFNRQQFSRGDVKLGIIKLAFECVHLKP